MCVFIDFEKLKIKNNFLHIFNFLLKLSLKTILFFVHFKLLNKFFSLKNIKFKKNKNKK